MTRPAASTFGQGRPPGRPDSKTTKRKPTDRQLARLEAEQHRETQRALRDRYYQRKEAA